MKISLPAKISIFLLAIFFYTNAIAQEIVSFDKYPVGYLNDQNEFVGLTEMQLKKFWSEYGKVDLASLNQPISIEIKWSETLNQNRFLVKTTASDKTQIGSLLNSIEREGKTYLIFESKMDYVLGYCKTDGDCVLSINEKDQFICVAPAVKNDVITCKKSEISFGKNSTLFWKLYFPKE